MYKGYFKITEKKPKYVDIGNGYYVHKVGKDANGNKSIWVAKGSNKAKKIQTNGNLPTVHRNASDILWFQDKNDKDVSKGIQEISDFMKESFREAKNSKAMNKRKQSRKLKKRQGRKVKRKNIKGNEVETLSSLYPIPMIQKNEKDFMDFLESEGFDVDDVTNVYDSKNYVSVELGSREYLVFDDYSEAEEKAREYLQDQINDMGYEIFDKDFWMSHVDESGLARDLTMDMSHAFDMGYDDPENYLDEEPEEEDGEYSESQKQKAGEIAEEQEIERIEDDPVSYIMDMGSEETLQNYIDEDSLIDEAINMDGVGNFLSSHDGNELEYGKLYAYRVN